VIKKLVSVLLLASFAACFFALLGCGNDDAGLAVANEDLISHKAFRVSGGVASPGSSIAGSIFVMGEQGSTTGSRIQIIATLQVGSDDWAGVDLDIPREWRVSSVLSDYPQTGDRPESYVNILHTGAEVAFNTSIRIGNTKYTELVRGGQGNISISLEPAVPVKELPKNVDIICGVGSQGDLIEYASYETISVPLSSQ